MQHLTEAGTRAPHRPEVLAYRHTWNPAFNNSDQQDVHEAFQTLLGSCDDVDASAMHTLPACRHMTRVAFARSAYRASTPHNQIFGNLQVVRSTCTACNETYEQYERAHAHDLSLDKREHTTLDVLLADHFGDEPLDEAFRCDACGASGRGTKNTEVLHWPPVLAISFKRFVFDRRTGSLAKEPRPIDYPLFFPVRDGVTYRLRAVILHRSFKATSAASGHYVAYVRDAREQWYYCDDTAVPRLVPNRRDALRPEAYMLFYER